MTDGERDVLHEIEKDARDIGEATFDAHQWVEWEIQSHMDGYGNTRRQAARFVRDLLQEDEYADELEPDQVSEAVVAVLKILK